ncbi:competence protein ComGF [Lentibacillus persicus]|uniref:Competence protein ComGF n=1 Tax=Lentibacillus persicus TaxID=640948 RepID=A0A1I1T5L4_9BACI|nr:ComGF family competence protein [Lentibacillus persicus]SFD53879.1 competence protein ComGF [Lentibacillus persicus]
MFKIKQSNSAYTAFRRDESGVTFISILLMISIIFTTIPFAIYLAKAVNIDSNYDALSVQQFFNYLRDEVISASDLTIEPRKLTLDMADGSTATFQKYDDRIVRRLNNGFEIYLREVQNVKFTPSPFGVRASITTINGDQYEKTIVAYN